MKSLILKGTVAAAGLFALTSVAAAQVEATATADLNLRTGPGTGYPVVDVIRSSEQVIINGCDEGGSWCSVNHAGVEGWAYSGYLATEQAMEVMPRTTYETTGAVEVEVVPPPREVITEVAPPPREVITYVERNRVEPIYLEGEVSVGIGLPETVEVYDIPDYDYRYVYVNGRPVLVEPQSRRVVYVMP
ncbi:DUF1236 domain-containing protein [Chelativorans salis]|uniref:DUF1236 domain-containing protein n=1 Tax=Chelativorans salis TaxID=2978478 RepID=A0ABT2LPK2_9HYPH|nr:DUF1236 domain-containing protein [Chelativorans sp. EGI FJ00035]MCT7376490.1 DUF1236 domain-containing protein [Chelativorans sp. EGI FJ00035]